MPPHDVVVIGGGHNGLIAASLLGQAGLKPLVLERASQLGGCAGTSELAPGFQCPTLAHRAAIDPLLTATLHLARHGLERLAPAALVSAPAVDGRMLTLWSDTSQAARDIARFSAADAERYPRLLETIVRVSSVLRTLMAAPPPALDAIRASDFTTLLNTGRKLRGLGRADGQRLVKWLPMSVADFVGEWFESEPLLATVAAEGLLGAFLGPRSPGGAAALLLLGAREGRPISPGWTPRGGMQALVRALTRAAQEAGAEIRVDADVQRVLVHEGKAMGVALASGEEVHARAVISNADPRRTLLGLVDPIHLMPEFLRQVQNLRMRGTLAKVNYAVSGLPHFDSLSTQSPQDQRARLSGCVRLCPDTTTFERAFDAAKYGEIAPEPWIEMAIPSIADPALAPEGQHVVSVYVQFAPFALRGTSWDGERERLGDLTTRTIARYAPQFPSSVIAREVLTPLDLERTYGLTGGHIFHGEIALDQLFLARPFLGWARYQTPIRNLFLCGSGTHPGTGLDGRSGALAAREVISAIRRGDG